MTFFNVVRRFHYEADTKVFSRVISDESIERAKLLGFFLVALGISLRITKTTAELAKWHIPKEERKATVSLS